MKFEHFSIENRAVPSIICNSCTKDLDDLAKQLLFWEVDLPSAACLKQELVHWKLFWNEGRREDKPENFMDILPYADETFFQTLVN